MERIRINNFAGLREVDTAVSPVTGFIGPQASGKSIIAKLLYFFREVASRLPDAAIRFGPGSAHYRDFCVARFNGFFSVGVTAGASDFHITYTSGSEHVSVESAPDQGKPGSRRLEWSAFYPSALESLAKKRGEHLSALGEAYGESTSDAQEKLLREFDEEAKKVLDRWPIYQHVFIPAGRAFFSQFARNVFSVLQSGADLDPFMVAFGAYLEQTRGFLQAAHLFDPASADAGRFGGIGPLMKSILHAELGFDEKEKQYFLQHDDGRRVWMGQASSGQQEALPLLLVLARSFSRPHGRGRALYIEEPEAHLFPPAQKQIVELLGRVFRSRADEMNLVVTTHSPYILTSFNNLVQAGKLYRRYRETKARPAKAFELSKTIPSSFDPGVVSFYALEGGSAKSIMDPETGLIDAGMIDQVSADIAIEFDKLLSEADEKP
jgi:hypothetical protein